LFYRRQVDEQSDNECFDELMTSDVLPDDVAGQVEVHYLEEQQQGCEPETLECLWAETQAEEPGESDKAPGKLSKKPRVSRKYVTSKPMQAEEPGESEKTKAKSSKKPRVPKKSITSKPLEVDWKKQKPNFTLKPVNHEKDKISQLITQLIEKSEVELFEQFWDDEVFDMITTQSELHAHQQNRHQFAPKLFQLKRFVGFLIFSGYHKLPREDMYWENAQDCSISIVTNAMSRQTYRDIKKNLHLVDNSQIPDGDKFYKIRSYIELLNRKFCKFGVFAHNLSIDEQMIPYFGRHSCKMFMKGKPVRFGFKAWCLCSSDGYLFNAIPYAGRDDYVDYDLGLGASVVLQLLQVVEEPIEHAVYFDNFFTSYKLLQKLTEHKFCATGTVREPRLLSCTLDNSKALSKKERGSYDYRFDKSNLIFAVKWNDNAVVTLASNFQSHEPLLTARRYSRTEKKVVTVHQPNLISAYNANMGGMDMVDNFIAKYRIAIKGKKWWWPLFINYVDIAVCNAWSLHRRNHGKGMDLLEFRRRVAISLLATKPPGPDEEPADEERDTTALRGCSSKLKQLSDPRRHSHSDHFITKNEYGRRLRCRLCKSTTCYICSRCKVGMHAKCFAE
jgi:hypothetical protein